MVLALACSAVGQLKVMGEMMAIFEAVFIVPIYQCVFLLWLIICGAVFFDEFSHTTTTNLAVFAIAVLVCFFGIFLLTSRKHAHNNNDANTPTNNNTSATPVAAASAAEVPQSPTELATSATLISTASGTAATTTGVPTTITVAAAPVALLAASTALSSTAVDEAMAITSGDTIIHVSSLQSLPSLAPMELRSDPSEVHLHA
jgi:ABC-type transport system involved in multi-copper enzyme maturation permease subunit